MKKNIVRFQEDNTRKRSLDVLKREKLLSSEYSTGFLENLWQGKVFDCISHDVLIAKLAAYGSEKSTLLMIYDYLKNRM